jgi:hydrogenase expression/formation protein HypC
MCISLPGTVVAVQGPAALIETGGRGRWCNALLQPDIEPGDRVLVHAGLVVEVLSPERAREIEEAFAELADRSGGPAAGASPDW